MRKVLARCCSVVGQISTLERPYYRGPVRLKPSAFIRCYEHLVGNKSSGRWQTHRIEILIYGSSTWLNDTRYFRIKTTLYTAVLLP